MNLRHSTQSSEAHMARRLNCSRTEVTTHMGQTRAQPHAQSAVEVVVQSSTAPRVFPTCFHVSVSYNNLCINVNVMFILYTQSRAASRAACCGSGSASNVYCLGNMYKYVYVCIYMYVYIYVHSRAASLLWKR